MGVINIIILILLTLVVTKGSVKGWAGYGGVLGESNFWIIIIKYVFIEWLIDGVRIIVLEWWRIGIIRCCVGVADIADQIVIIIIVFVFIIIVIIVYFIFIIIVIIVYFTFIIVIIVYFVFVIVIIV